MKWSRKHSEEMKKLAKSMYEQGKSKEEISEATGYKVSSVSTILNNSGVYQYEQSKINAQKIVELYKQGIKTEKIAEIVGYSRNNVYNVLSRNGYGVRKNTKGFEEECENLTYAADIDCPGEVIYAEGKRYRDITHLFTGN